ncbi:anti-sigma factor homolog yrhM [Lachnospiraceae bacterium KM106-2]|nr:anti-sigma factor homolog yrhM [Lachnospiraceae bacterium KM106-2]
MNQAIEASKRNKKIKVRRIAMRSASLAACLLLGFTIGVNSSESFAKTVQDIPVLGGFAKVVTVRSYQENTKDQSVDVEIPEVKIVKEKSTSFTKEVNAQINKMCDQYVKEAKVRANDYRQAFIKTGGTEKEWKAHDITIQVGYEIKSQRNNILSFVINGTENWTSAYSMGKYYNVDIKSGRFITLKDVLGSNYIAIANKSIKQQMAELQKKDKDLTFWSAKEGGFTTINEKTPFYLDQEWNL